MSGGLVAVVAVAGWLFLRDVDVVRDSLDETRASLSAVRSALGDIDVDDARASLAAADASLGVARSRSSGPLWTLASMVPVAGDSVEVVRAVVDVGSAALDVARVAVTDGQALVARGVDIRIDDGQVDLSHLDEAREIIDALPIAQLVAARDRLADVEPRWAPDEIHAGHADSLALANEAIDTADRAQALLDALPGFLGVDQPRNYFLGVQTPAELRGTGGLIGYWAILHVDGGRFELRDSSVHDPLDDFVTDVPGDLAADVDADDAGVPASEPDPVVANIGLLRGDRTNPVPTTPEFAARYGPVAANAHFSNVNVDPDLPTTARVALDLFTWRTGDRLDGMVLIDPIGMQSVLEAVGRPVVVPPGLEHDDLPDVLEPAEFARFSTVDVYEIFGHGHSTQRRQLLRALGDAAFTLVFDGAWDGPSVAGAVAEAASTRHLQVFSEHPVEQDAFRRLGVAGELRAPDHGDFLAVTANNAVGGKQDVHVEHSYDVTVELGEPMVAADGTVYVDRTARIRVTVDNPLPSSGMDAYIIGNCLVGQPENQCFDGPPGWNRTWFSVWSPTSSTLRAAQSSNGHASVTNSRFNGLRVVDRDLGTPPQGSAWFEVEISGPVTVDARGDVVDYQLHLWHQSSALEAPYRVVVEPPEGWAVVAAAGGAVTSNAEAMPVGPDGDVMLELRREAS